MSRARVCSPFLVLMICINLQVTRAQDEINTDLPDLSSSVIPTGSVQLENGVGWSSHGGVSTIDGSESLVRVGLAEHGEIRAAFPVWYGTFGLERSFGFTDIQVGWKQQLVATGLFQLAIAPALSVPTGSHGLTAGAFEPQVGMAWSKSFNDRWSSSGVEIVSYVKGAGRHFFEAETVLTAARRLSSKTDTYLEYEGLYGPFGPAHRVEVGISYKGHPNHQIDFLFGGGVNGGSSEITVGAGFSFRVGRHGVSGHP